MCGRRIYGYWGIEHVVIKGNNGMKIFNDDEDCRYCKSQYKFDKKIQNRIDKKIQYFM